MSVILVQDTVNLQQCEKELQPQCEDFKDSKTYLDQHTSWCYRICTLHQLFLTKLNSDMNTPLQADRSKPVDNPIIVYTGLRLSGPFPMIHEDWTPSHRELLTFLSHTDRKLEKDTTVMIQHKTWAAKKHVSCIYLIASLNTHPEQRYSIEVTSTLNNAILKHCFERTFPISLELDKVHEHTIKKKKMERKDDQFLSVYNLPDATLMNTFDWTKSDIQIGRLWVNNQNKCRFSTDIVDIENDQTIVGRFLGVFPTIHRQGAYCGSFEPSLDEIISNLYDLYKDPSVQYYVYTEPASRTDLSCCIEDRYHIGETTVWIRQRRDVCRPEMMKVLLNIFETLPPELCSLILDYTCFTNHNRNLLDLYTTILV